MTDAWVLMTAMPPTKGHLNLIRFAEALVRPSAGHANVIVCTQPGEPFADERYRAIVMSVGKHTNVIHLHQELEQNPQAWGFWDMWRDLMLGFGVLPGDFIVSSEPYGASLATLTKGHFMPYDPARELYFTKATQIRENPAKYFENVMEDFQPNMIKRVTVWGAESTGKTTLSHELSVQTNGHWLFEYARPYLETCGTEISVKSMTDIWKGQLALQDHADTFRNKPWIIQDTDLFSTIGYWAQPHWKKELGPVPLRLYVDAHQTKSDLYIITKSDIPFEIDPIRYGGNVRESPDDYWIKLADSCGLNYVVLESTDKAARVSEARMHMERLWAKTTAKEMFYDRKGQ